MMRVYDLKAGHSRRVLANNNPTTMVDPTGLEGVLSLQTDGGHAWISYTRFPADGFFGPDGWTQTYETSIGGFHLNEALGRQSTHAVHARLTNAQERALLEYVNQRIEEDEYQLKGNNCADFATEAWRRAGQDSRFNGGRFGYSDPSVLANQIRDHYPNPLRATAASPYGLGLNLRRANSYNHFQNQAERTGKPWRGGQQYNSGLRASGAAYWSSHRGSDEAYRAIGMPQD